MVQQNQAISRNDPADFSLKRKRGRPRKYDGPGYEPHQRCSQNQAIPSPRYPTSGLSQGPLIDPGRANLNLMLSLRPQACSSQAIPPISCRQGFDIPTQANPAGISSLRSHASPVQHISFHIPASGSQTMEAQSSARCNAGYLTGASVNHRSRACPAQTNPVTDSGIYHQANPVANSSHGTHALVGQTVSGTLDGKFDAGYLLTVRVGGTGDVLKGLVFDPHLCVPVSAENDIAPLLSVTKSDANTTCPPIHSVPKSVTITLPLQKKEPTAPLNPVNHAPECYRPTEAASKTIGGVAATNEPCVLQDEILQSEVKTTVSNEKEKYMGDVPQEFNLNDTGSEISLRLAVTNETNQVQSDQTRISIEAPGMDRDRTQDVESSKNIVEAPKENQDLHETVKSSGKIIKESEPDEGQNQVEVSSLKDIVKAPKEGHDQQEIVSGNVIKEPE